MSLKTDDRKAIAKTIEYVDGQENFHDDIPITKWIRQFLIDCRETILPGAARLDEERFHRQAIGPEKLFLPLLQH